MNSMEILSLTATELSEKIKQKEITVVEATKAVLEQIKKAEPVINSYVTVDEEGALVQAEEVQKKIDAALETLKQNGEYDKIYAKWFGEKK